MQALSLAVHIPIVCFGIAFPAMFLFVEGLYLRTGDADLQGARQALVEGRADPVRGRRRHRHDPVVRVRAAVAGVHGDASARCSGSRSRSRAISFFVEAIFIAIYVYGWDRLPPRAHFLTGIPVVISGFAGSFNVIAVNGWMNDPHGLRRRRRPGRRTRSPWDALFNDEHVARADPHVPGGLHRRRLHRRRRLRATRGCAAGATATTAPALVVTLAFASLAAPVQVDRRRLGRARGRRDASRSSSPRSRACDARRRARRSRSAASTTPTRARSAAGSRSRSCSRCSPSTTRTRRSTGSTSVPARGPAAGQHRALRVPDDGRDRHRPRAARRRLPRHLVAPAAAAALAVVLPRGDGRPARCRSSR